MGECKFPQMMQFLCASWKSTVEEQLELTDHLVVCETCRTAARVLLTEGLEMHLFKGARRVKWLWQLLLSLEEVEMQSLLPAFVQVTSRESREAAQKCYPQVAKHLDRCLPCREVYELTLFLCEGERL